MGDSDPTDQLPDGISVSGPHHIATVVKAGSADSPAVLSPTREIYKQLGQPSVEGLCSLAPTTWSPPPLTHSGHLPLSSPSERAGCGSRPQLTRGADFSMADAVPGDGQPPTPPSAVEGRMPLRLPSFQFLGIANPHLDNFKSQPQRTVFGHDGSIPGVHTKTPPQPQPNNLSFFHGIRSPFHPSTFAALTPPDELPSHNFAPLVSDTATIPTTSESQAGIDSIRANEPKDIALSTAGDTGSSADLGLAEQAPDVEHDEAWLQQAISTILRNIDTTSFGGNQMRILSHALPSPSAPGHIFPIVIEAVRMQLPPSPLTWINVFHAVPGRFNLADLPTSPPSTPGIPFSGAEDYFTTKVFDSAVPIADYESDQSPMSVEYPQPVVPPSTVNLSIVERFIPPASRREFADMFDPNGLRSILADRLVELSPNNGTLVFIYPTRKGGQTFQEEYLGPLLDPLLRSMVVVHGFSSNFSAGLGQMCAVDYLNSFEITLQKLKRFCHSLSQSNSGILERLHGTAQAHFTVEYAVKHNVTPAREVWTDWWVKQEKTRIRTVVNKYFQSGRNVVQENHEVSPANLIQEILEGIKKRNYTGSTPSPMEVGVFILKRQH